MVQSAPLPQQPAGCRSSLRSPLPQTRRCLCGDCAAHFFAARCQGPSHARILGCRPCSRSGHTRCSAQSGSRQSTLGSRHRLSRRLSGGNPVCCCIRRYARQCALGCRRRLCGRLSRQYSQSSRHRLSRQYSQGFRHSLSRPRLPGRLSGRIRRREPVSGARADPDPAQRERRVAERVGRRLRDRQEATLRVHIGY